MKERRKLFLPLLLVIPMIRRSSLRFQLAFCGKFRYVKRPEEAEAVCKELLKKKVRVIGVDAEWNAVYRRGRPPSKTALLQLAWEDVSSRASTTRGKSKWSWDADKVDRHDTLKRKLRVELLHLKHFEKFPETLRKLLEDPTILKVGAHVKGDCGRLVREGVLFAEASGQKRSKNQLQLHEPSSYTSYFNGEPYDTSDWIEIERIARKRLKLEKFDLVEICRGLYGDPIDKGERMSNWEADELSKDQQIYASTDAAMHLACYLALEEMDDLPIEEQQMRRTRSSPEQNNSKRSVIYADWDAGSMKVIEPRISGALLENLRSKNSLEKVRVKTGFVYEEVVKEEGAQIECKDGVDEGFSLRPLARKKMSLHEFLFVPERRKATAYYKIGFD